MSRLVVLPETRADLIDIGDYIALDNRERALTFLAEVEAKMLKAAERPDSFPARDE